MDGVHLKSEHFIIFSFIYFGNPSLAWRGPWSDPYWLKPAASKETRFPRLCCWLPDCFDYSTEAELSLAINPPSLAQHHHHHLHHHHSLWDAAAKEDRREHAHSHHSSSSSIIPPITLEGRGQGRTRRGRGARAGQRGSWGCVPSAYTFSSCSSLTWGGITVHFPCFGLPVTSPRIYTNSSRVIP